MFAKSTDVAQVLIEHGADVNARDYEGNTVLQLAKTDDIKSLLRAYGAK
jgi:ankyrin repeat protein